MMPMASENVFVWLAWVFVRHFSDFPAGMMKIKNFPFQQRQIYFRLTH